MRHKTLLLTLFSLFLMSLPALAVEPVLTVGAPTYGTDTVTVPITLAANGASLTSVAVNISYDPTVLSKPVGVIGAAATGKALYNNVDATTGDPAAVNAEGVLAPSLGTYRILIAGDTGPNAATNTAVYPAADIAGARTVLTDGEVATVTFTTSSTAASAINLTSSPFVSDADGSALVAQGVNRSSINLSQGWNLISLPLAPSQTTVGTVLGSTPYRNIWGFSAGSWRMFDPSNPIFSNLTNVAAGNGYWIYATSATKLQFPGTTADKTVSLATGWNMVGFNATSSQSASTAIASMSSSVDKIWGFKNGSWQLYDPSNPIFSNLTTLESGRGYWIKMKQSGTWTLP